jgi:outer membrane protein OmpA-like peptidoglycan-associated protein
MASSMLESILDMVTPEMQQALATRLGESTTSVQNGLSSATATLLGGIAHNAGDANFIDQMMQLASRANSQNLFGGLASIASGGLSGTTGDLVTRFLSVVFGTQQGQVGSQIAQQSGLGIASAAGLLKMAAPLVLAYLGKLHSAGRLSASTFGNSQRMDTTSRNVRLVESRASASGGSRWAVPGAIVGALLLGWLVFRSMHTGPAMREAAEENTSTSSWTALGEPQKVTLPDGNVITVPAHGVEARLLGYLQASASPAGAVTWFDFDRLLFDSGQATLQPASYDQLNNVAAILKAYPTAKIRLGGYTDNTGDPNTNQKLSEERANNVMAQLTQRGIDPARLSAIGYGGQDPVADNSTEEGRQKNRRISFRVAEK